MTRPDGCVCNYGPDSDGPEEDCPHHGRPYAYWVDRGDELSMRIALALEALAWDRPYDTRIEAAQKALRGES